VSGIRLGDSRAKRGRNYVTYNLGKLLEECGNN